MGTMTKIVECVPNFSEGRDRAKIFRILQVIENYPEIKLVNYEIDADYNRTVVTLIGDPVQLIDLLADMTAVALKEIDLNQHSGAHARMGAIDVIPFVPIQGVTLDDCIDYSKTLAAKIADKYHIPCFLYAEAARCPERVKLPDIRCGEFEGMKEKIKQAQWKPDYGPAEIHETFGVIGIGAREFLIACNMDIDTRNEKNTRLLARAIRQTSGGFQYIQAGPVYLKNRGHTQVSMNMLNYKKNPLYRVFETVKMEARRFGYSVPSTEIIGLVPKDALVQSLEYYYGVNRLPFDEEMPIDTLVKECTKFLELRNFDKNKIIESFL